jgi:SAM-dependent methyltransferase
LGAPEHWKEEAARWAAWARAPGHDAFFELVPPPGRATLEVGCGEGRVARDLAARDHRVIAIDITQALASLASEANAGPRYVLADGAMLPFQAATFDVAVAYNSLMDVDDMPAVVQEIGRVLAPGGRLCVCVTHPLMDAGRFTARDPEVAFVIETSYLARRPYEGMFERDGLGITFKGWCYPLSTYSRALEASGFLVETLREPEPSPTAPARMERYRRIPNFLMLRALKPASRAGSRARVPRPRRTA